jgi:hypothetical protein
MLVMSTLFEKFQYQATKAEERNILGKNAV